MRARQLGSSGPSVSALGLGCMGCPASTVLPTRPRAPPPSTPRSTPASPCSTPATSTAWAHNELLIGRALQGRDRGQVTISVKSAPSVIRTALARLRRPSGRGEDGPSPTRCAGSAATTSTSTGRRASTPRCRSKTRSVRSPSWCRPATPATSDSPRSAPTPSGARTPCTDQRPADRVLAGLPRASRRRSCYLPGAGIAVTAYGVLSRGLLSSAWSAGHEMAGGDMRAHMPRFQGENLTPTSPWPKRAERRRGDGRERGAGGDAWVLSAAEDVVPLIVPGAGAAG